MHPLALLMLAKLFAAERDDDKLICLSSVSSTTDGGEMSTFEPQVNGAGCLTTVSLYSSSRVDSVLVMQVATPILDSMTSATLFAGSFSGDCTEMKTMQTIIYHSH